MPPLAVSRFPESTFWTWSDYVRAVGNTSSPCGKTFVLLVLQAEGKGKKSKEQLEAEKRAILKQRIKPLEIDSMGESQLAEKARELHTHIVRLEGEKYDLEKRFKQLQVEVRVYDMI